MMPPIENKEDNLESVAYLNENVGGYTAAGAHHQDGSQDTFWPALVQGNSPISGLSRLDVIQHGRLYILADGVSLCADGQEASRLATETAGKYYYHTTQAYPDNEDGRRQRLEDAVWQAHLALSNWDERYFCWRSEQHADGGQRHFKKEQLASLSSPRCPLCNGQLVGLQTTLIAILVRGQRLTLVGIGDSSAFRLPYRAEFGVEWIHTPQEDQFLGMPSLTRQAVAAQSFLLTSRDRILLVSDGVLRVLNGLHPDMGWHSYLRERIGGGDLSSQTRNLIQDLDSWRLTRPQQRKLQDDLTVVSVGVVEDATRRKAVDTSLSAYDHLQAEQQQKGVLPARDYEGFLDSAETALFDTDDPQLWQLYSNGVHGFALSKLNESTAFDDKATRELLRNAARLTRRTKEWVLAHRQLARLATWSSGTESPVAVPSEQHNDLIGDLYGVDIREATPNIIPRIVDMLLNVASQLDQGRRPDDSSQYKSFANYLSSAQPNATKLMGLPTRDEAIASPSVENSQALELQIAQAIADQDWQIAQELIIELNKLKGADTLNLDTESVDTRQARRRQWQPAPRLGGGALLPPTARPAAPLRVSRPIPTPSATTFVSADADAEPIEPPSVEIQTTSTLSQSPTVFDSDFNTERIRDMLLGPSVDSAENTQKVGDIPLENGAFPPSMPPGHDTPAGFTSEPTVYYSSNPLDLVRDSARFAFDEAPELRDLSRGYELMLEANRQHPDLSILKTDWEALWGNYLHEFTLDAQQDLDDPSWQLRDLSMALQIARDAAIVQGQSSTYDLQDLRPAQAKSDLRSLMQFSEQLKDGMLPYELGLGAVWHARELCAMRVTLPQVPDTVYAARPKSPFVQARRHFTDVMWQAILAQGVEDQPNQTYRYTALTLLDEVQALQEMPWAEAAQELQVALQQDSLVIIAFYLHQLKAPEGATREEKERFSLLQAHYANAAWEHVFAMAERRKPIDRMKLQATQGALVNAPFDVTRLSGSLGLRLSIIYNLLGILIHDVDGPIVNGFYAYEIKVPRQLEESDFRRLNNLRNDYITRAWDTTLVEARTFEPFFLPPSSRFVSRIKPDGTTPEGRRLQAIRALLPILGQAYDDWIEIAALMYDWQPPLPLAMPDQHELNETKEQIVENAWQYALQSFRGGERPDLTTGRIHQLRTRLAELNTEDKSDRASGRLRALLKMMPALLKIKSPTSSRVMCGAAAQKVAHELAPLLPEDDSTALRSEAKELMDQLWDWCLRVSRNPFSSQVAAIRTELSHLPNSTTELGDGSVWQAMDLLLQMASQRLDDSHKQRWEPAVKQVFTAFRMINLASKSNESYLKKSEQLDELAYGYLADWKDSLPVRPNFWQKRAVNAEKRRIQSFWLLRKEYAAE